MIVEVTPKREPAGSSDERLMAVICHLGGFFTSILVPLVLWLVQKERSPFVAHHGRESFYFQLTLLLFYFLFGAVALIAWLAVGIDWVFLAVVVLVAFAAFLYETVLIVWASIAAYRGTYFRYPLTIRIV